MTLGLSAAFAEEIERARTSVRSERRIMRRNGCWDLGEVLSLGKVSRMSKVSDGSGFQFLGPDLLDVFSKKHRVLPDVGETAELVFCGGADFGNDPQFIGWSGAL